MTFGTVIEYNGYYYMLMYKIRDAPEPSKRWMMLDIQDGYFIDLWIVSTMKVVA